MKLFNWINPLWIMDNFLTTHFEPVSATTAAMAAPSILAGTGSTLTGAGMMTAGAPIGSSLLSSTTPGLLGGLGSFGGAAMDSIKANPFGAAGLGMGVYDRMNQSQAPLQQSPMLSAQQLIGQRQAVPNPEFNSMLQLPRRPIYIG
jgi:hypothetical protein